MPIRRVSAVKDHASGAELAFRTRATAEQELMSRDPIGELIVEVPNDLMDDYATVIELQISNA
jgi:hypothetical protein